MVSTSTDVKPIPENAERLTVAISDLKLLSELQARVGATDTKTATADSHVRDLITAIESGEDLPPPKVFQVEDGTLLLTDGHHTLEAHRQSGRNSIEVLVAQGTRDDARWAAAGANTRHGLKRTNDDKRRAVELALMARESRSDRSIADHVLVSPTFVGSVRGELEASGVLRGHLTTRTGRDGKGYTVPAQDASSNSGGSSRDDPNTEVAEGYGGCSIPSPQPDPFAKVRKANATIKRLLKEIGPEVKTILSSSAAGKLHTALEAKGYPVEIADEEKMQNPIDIGRTVKVQRWTVLSDLLEAFEEFGNQIGGGA
ncbi:MAG: hypothetical protein K8U57_32955 [Planctomycetes bacterium]|nr:hypothetical protein [Planctomycetota bacterium]